MRPRHGGPSPEFVGVIDRTGSADRSKEVRTLPYCFNVAQNLARRATPF